MQKNIIKTAHQQGEPLLNTTNRLDYKLSVC